MIPLSAVVAVTPSYGIGNLGSLPWGNSLPSDLAYFRKITTSTIDKTKKNAVIMGRLTWLGIPEKNRPLKGRVNIVLTGNKEWAESSLPNGVFAAANLKDAMNLIENEESIRGSIETAVVVGGVQLFEESILDQMCDTYHVTKIDTEFDCDTILTQKTIEKIDSLTPLRISEVHEENGISYT
jgi:dihydrofolate reductase